MSLPVLGTIKFAKCFSWQFNIITNKTERFLHEKNTKRHLYIDHHILDIYIWHEFFLCIFINIREIINRLFKLYTKIKPGIDEEFHLLFTSLSIKVEKQFKHSHTTSHSQLEENTNHTIHFLQCAIHVNKSSPK